MTKAAAIYQFWNGFEIPAFEENSVPDDAEFPYITYQFVEDSVDQTVQSTASVWYRSTSWTGINLKIEEISRKIGSGGTILKCDDGRIWICRGQPFSQNMRDESDDLIRRKYLNLNTEFFTND